MKRRFLLLQGVCSPFFDRLGQALDQAGHDVAKIIFNAGDSWYWHGKNKIIYRRNISELPIFYERLLEDHAYTDLILFGDRRPVHRPALELARTRDVRTHVFEEGYFRPYWITLERSGVNAHSQLPRNPAWYRRVGPAIPEYGNGEAFSPTFITRAWHDVVYHVAGMRNPLCYPGYQSHAQVPVAVEYSSYLRRAVTLPQARRRDAAMIQSLIYGRVPFWLLPLQLNSDVQIREHSPFSDMQHMLNIVLESFARMCRPDGVLVVKNHPLDPGLMDFPKIISDICRKLGLSRNRIVYLETGPLPALLNHARGVITANSTVGGSALVHARPLIALGDAIYNMPGLTFQGQLDEFWRYSRRPNSQLFRWFRNTVIHTTQINGGFYSRQSIKMAVNGALPRLIEDESRLERLMNTKH